MFVPNTPKAAACTAAEYALIAAAYSHNAAVSSGVQALRFAYHARQAANYAGICAYIAAAGNTAVWGSAYKHIAYAAACAATAYANNPTRQF